MIDPEDEDTIEMQLTPAQVAGLEEAAAEQAEREPVAARRERALIEVRPIEVRPKDVRPIEVRPIDVQPFDVRPIEVRPRAPQPPRTLQPPRAFPPRDESLPPADWLPGMSIVVHQVSLPPPIPAPKGRRYLLIASAGLVVALSVATAYQLGTRTRVSSVPEAAPQTIQRAPQSEAKLPEAPLPPPKAIPVRFTNPFDTSEVFEFPPGTSPTQARDAVAELLLKRAQQRQTQRPENPSFARRS